MISAVVAKSWTAVVIVQATAIPMAPSTATKPTNSERVITRMIKTPPSKLGTQTMCSPQPVADSELQRTRPEAAAQLDFAPRAANK